MNPKDTLARANRFAFFLLFFCIAFSSCKKCIVCQNTCYICKSTVSSSIDTICNTDYPNEDIFKELISGYKSHNYNCALSKPQREVELCDTKSSLNNFKQSYELLRYQCLDK